MSARGTDADLESRAEARERALLRRIKTFDSLPDGSTLGLREVLLIVGVSRASLYRKMSEGTFPRPAHAYNGNRWRVGDVRRFLAGGAR